MNKDSCFQLGYIAKVHGLHGELTVVLDVDFPEDYVDIEHVFVAQDSRLVTYFLEHFALQPNQKALAKCEGFDSTDEASVSVGSEFYLPPEDLQDPTEDQVHLPEL